MGLELEDGFVPLPKIRLTPTPLVLTLFPLLVEITQKSSYLFTLRKDI